jgi:hypothetical protein
LYAENEKKTAVRLYLTAVYFLYYVTQLVFLPESGLNLTFAVVAIVWLGGGCYLAE